VTQSAFICGLAGPMLNLGEKAFLAETRPAGMIIFSRNVEGPAQLKRLVAEARDAAGGESGFLVLVDQEGGRVQRLTQPHWRRYPAASAFKRAFPEDDEGAARSAKLCARLIARDLQEVGINTSCAPVLDVPVPGADKVIGNRAYGASAAAIIHLGTAVAEGLLAGGVLPVIKHIPGHGRAMADSHLALPVINASLTDLKETDFLPFIALRHLPMAMTAHVVLTSIDDSAPVTISKLAIDKVIRGMIGFNGLLMSDDLSMRALAGSLEERAKAALAAGCDLLLHCNGSMAEMEAVAAASPTLEGIAKFRFEAALAHLKEPEPFDIAEAEQAVAVSLAAQA
jgi:beta-N-acetylhexosaminidase